MKLSIGGKISIGYGLVLLALLLVGTVSFHNLRRLNEDSAWVTHTVEVLQKIESLSSKAVEAESGERGYLITQGAPYLTRFEELKPLIRDDVQSLRELTADNQAQQQRLDRLEGLLTERIALLEKVIHVFQSTGKIRNAETMALISKGTEDMNAFRQGLQEMAGEEHRLLKQRQAQAGGAEQVTAQTIIWGTVAAFLVVAVAGGLIVRGITSSLRLLHETATKIGSGDYGQRAKVVGADEVARLAKVFNAMAAQVEERQRTLAEQEWLKGNLARIASLFQGHRDLASICQMLASEIASVLGVRHAAFYLADGTGISGQPLLRWTAGYVVPDDRTTVRPGEGLIGQSFIEKKSIVVNEVPDEYMKIKSGFGEALPRMVAIHPILFEDRVRGVVELASFEALTPIQQVFLSELLNGLGLVLNSVEANLRIRESEVELQGQREELRQANEELQQTNEELGQANSELEERARHLDEQRVEMEQKNAEIRKAQDALEEKASQLAQTSKYKSEFLANMSHELRTPLNSLLILSQILMENAEGNLTPKQADYAKTIRGAGNDLLQLINDILDLAKIESGTVQAEIADVAVAELANLAEGTFRATAEQKKVEFRVDIDPGVPGSIRTDSRRLQQILKNLLSNAFKFTDRGSVAFRIEREEDGGIALSVKDTGLGIPEGKQQVIFEAFRQADSGTSRKYGGTGLGLSISRELAHLLGGSLSVSSVPGEGSTFTLRLPASLVPTPSAPAAPKKQAAEVREPDPSLEPESGSLPDDRATIRKDDRVLLVVEDDANFARLMADFAREKGFKVVATRRGEHVMSLAEKFQPIAITLDLHLPDQEGWVVLDRLKNSAATRHIPVHIVSVQEARDRSLRLGAVSFLQKPVTRNQVDSVLAEMQEFASKPVKNLLIVEDDPVQRQSVADLIGNGDVVATTVGTGAGALSALEAKKFDCLILDLGLPDMDGLELLRRIKEKVGGTLPIIIYTGRSLTSGEEMELQQISDAIIIKDVKSPERLLDETALFLHRVQSKLPEPKRQAMEQARKEDSILSGRTVLVVDDDPRNIFSITAALEQNRMRVLYAGNGREGLEILERTPEIEAVLMDVMMPEMDGFEAMRRIRGNPKFRRLPVLAITAKAMKGDREKCIEAGASDYITKPVDLDHLRSLLRVWLYK